MIENILRNGLHDPEQNSASRLSLFLGTMSSFLVIWFVLYSGFCGDIIDRFVVIDVKVFIVVAVVIIVGVIVIAIVVVFLIRQESVFVSDVKIHMFVFIDVFMEEVGVAIRFRDTEPVIAVFKRIVTDIVHIALTG